MASKTLKKLLILIVISQPGLSWGLPVQEPHNDCTLVDGLYELLTKGKESDYTTLVASSSAIRAVSDITSQIGLSEHVTLAMHFYFQESFNQKLAQSNIKIHKLLAPALKYLRYEILIPASGRKQLIEMMSDAKKSATESILDYLTTPGSNAERRLIAFNSKTGSELSPIVFPENQEKITLLSPDKLQELRQLIVKKYRNKEQIRSRLDSWYMTGLADNRPDAFFWARFTAADRSFVQPASFSPFRVRDSLLRAKKQKHALQWLFSVSEIDDLKLFGIIRSNQDIDDTSNWSLSYKKLLSRRFPNTALEALNDYQLILAHGELHDYLNTLNLFDILIENGIVPDPNARNRFNEFKNPTGYLYIDVRKLGARNLLLLHQSVEPLLALFDRIQTLLEKYHGAEDLTPAEEEQITNQLAELRVQFNNARDTLLEPTNTYITEVRNRIHQIVRSAGVKDQDYELWASGDDMLIVFRSLQLKPIDIGLKLKTDQEIGSALRIATASENILQKKANFDYVRSIVPPMAQILKTFETLERDYELIVTSNLNQPRRVNLHKIEGGTTVGMPEKDRSIARIFHPSWQIQ